MACQHGQQAGHLGQNTRNAVLLLAEYLSYINNMHMLYHQRKIILLLLLCGLAAEAASAQNQVRMEYDAAGNVVKAHPSMKLERATIDGRFSIKVYPSPTKGPLNIRVYDELTPTHGETSLPSAMRWVKPWNTSTRPTASL